MSDSSDFDMQAAWLRRFRADAESNLKAFALRLKEAMPELVTIRESKGFWSRTARVTGISVDLGNNQYTLELANGRLRATVAMVVRGITLNTKEIDPGDWFARLSRETRETTAHAKALSQSLTSFMES
ncbi:MAG TPA: hypothetical protein VJK90_14530 [Acetobacteraceae bacterium]|jgi:hypothetical protein|nr:hypothetical protein [Acetobacteraceae bacterium]